MRSRRRKVERQLTEVREEVARLREALRVLDEQAAYQRGETDAAQADAAVAGPLARRAWQEASGHLRRLEREREEKARRIAELVEEQDRLLERLLAEAGKAAG